MTTTLDPRPVTGPPSRATRLADRLADRLWRLPPGGGYTVTQGVRTPMRDGVDLVADLYTPTGTPSQGTILVRGPYGRNTFNSLAFARVYAARGWTVLLQSVRGTFGSGDAFAPMAREVDDGHDTVAWLRDQPWFDGRLATLGVSYLGFTQWALLMDPPPELRTAIVVVGPHDFHRSVHGSGAFALEDFLGWSDMVGNQEDGGLGRRLARMASAERRLAPALAGVPLLTAGEQLLGGRAPWYEDWLSRHDETDPFWAPMSLGAALDRVEVPVLLIGGWQDLFIRQTLDQYTHLHDRGIDVGLTVGPWVHNDLVTKAGGRVVKESLDWLGEHVAGRPGSRPTRVRIHVTGADGGWRGLAAWPPPTADRTLYLQGGAALSTTEPAAGTAAATFDYDPADPTPAVGGPLLGAGAGVRDNGALEARADVLTFTGPPLAATLEIAGAPVVELAHRSDNSHADLFVRLCEVDAKGRSRNVTDGFVRLTDADRDAVVRVELSGAAHRFAAGHRIRLQVSGGAHPRFARNLGTDEPAATGARMAPSYRLITIDGRSRVTLPVVTG